MNDSPETPAEVAAGCLGTCLGLLLHGFLLALPVGLAFVYLWIFRTYGVWWTIAAVPVAIVVGLLVKYGLAVILLPSADCDNHLSPK